MGLEPADDPGTDVTAGEVVTAAIRDLVRQFDETEPPALAGDDEGVHEHRTVVRRLRGALREFRDLLDPFAVTEVRRSLGEWGSALGVVRDHEVAAQLAEALMADVSAWSGDSRITARLVQSEREAALVSHQRIVQLHDLGRLEEMRRRLHGFADGPPLNASAGAPAESLRQLLLHDAGRVLRRARRPAGSLDSQHTLRKRARRLRHAIEAALTDPPGVFDDRLRGIAKAAHRIQSALGDHRDATLLAARIDHARVLAGRSGEDVLAYDELAARARAFADERRRAVAHLRKKLATAIERAE